MYRRTHTIEVIIVIVGDETILRLDSLKDRSGLVGQWRSGEVREATLLVQIGIEVLDAIKRVAAAQSGGRWEDHLVA